MKNQEFAEPTNAQKNVHRIIAEWKKRRAEDENEAAEKMNSSEYQEIFKKLAEQNEQRKKRILNQ